MGIRDWAGLCAILLNSVVPAAAQPTGLETELRTPLTSRQVELRFVQLGLEEGLSQGSVQAIYQDRQGFMWFGTQDGLNRFDGHNITVYKREPFDEFSLSSGRINGIDQGPDGSLWLATGLGLNRMEPITEQFTAYRHDPDNPASLGQDFVTDVTVGDGRLWATHLEGLDVMDLDDPGAFIPVYRTPFEEGIRGRLTHGKLLQDAAGTVWVGTANGVLRIDGIDPPAMTPFLDLVDETGCRSPNANPRQNEVFGLLERPEEPGILWVASDMGLARLDMASEEVQFFEPPDRDPCYGLMRITQDPMNPGILWIAAGEGGLLRFDIRSGSFSRYTSTGANSGLFSGLTWSTFTDRSGIIWVGTFPRGLSRFDPASVGLSSYTHKPDDPNSLRGQSITGIYQTEDGHVWVSTWGEDSRFVVTELDRTTGTATHYRHDPNNRTTISNGQIWGSFAEDPAGYVWIGSEGGLDRLDRQTGRIWRLSQSIPTLGDWARESILSMYLDSSGMLWIGQIGRLVSLDPLEPTNVTVFEPDPDNAETILGGGLMGMSEDRAGSLWVSSNRGLFRLDPISQKVTRYNHDPEDEHSLSADYITYAAERRREPGVIWASTYGGGLNRLDVATGRFRRFTERDGLSNNGLYGFIEDDEGRLWIATNRGLSRFDPDTETFRNFGLEIGLQSLEFNSTAFFRGPFGEAFFGGTSGLNSFFPNEFDENSTPPEVTLVDLKLFNESIKSSGVVSLDEPLAETAEVVLSHDQTDLEFEFVAFHYADPKSNEYAYMLDGWNDDWVYVGNKRSASFTNLDPGLYTFHVKAANSDGVWNEVGATLDIVIEPPWWRSWWAYAFYALAFCVGVFGVDRFQRRRLLAAEAEKAREKELEHAREIEVAYNELRTTQDRLIQSEKMASLGQLTAGIAHEIKNPLNFVNNFSDLSKEMAEELAEQVEKHRSQIPPELAEEFDDLLGGLKMNVSKIFEHGKRADSIVFGMLQHSRTGEAERAEIDLNALVDEHLNLAYHGKRAQQPDMNADLKTDYDDSVGRVEVIPQDLGRVLLNLVGNALDAVYGVGNRDQRTVKPTIKRQHQKG